ncbi:uncharacterized protein BYT42DRAFT_553661 [Radiomyces spectabilis]|uniref:uncharacterized protein n=1 Tax=Radiomyces spectabilis TaxID=64574 RepID=UPI00221E8BE7|nr:uncharacterized protein BYT42DRAFT_553661 [Radiomyces spectabilis]KAI8394189.1 hypothetical protein BYT42DRAFT_553661 [Radiomyces spectabilis]
MLSIRHISRRAYTSLNRPGPIPLGNKKQQQEMLDLIRKKNQQDMKDSGALHDDARLQLEPEFEGNVNPKTGEVNGPKNEPLRHGDWSFSGRVTDF